MAQDIRIIKVDRTTGRITFDVGSSPITGAELLTQIVVLSLLNTPGQDVFDPDNGGGIPEMIGMNIEATDSTEILAEVSRRIKKTKVEIANAQSGLNLSGEQKLRDLVISEITKGDTIDEVFVRIKIINEAGRVTDITV